MDHERFGLFHRAEEGIIRSKLAKDSHPRAHVFSSCNEKIIEIVVRGTTKTKRTKQCLSKQQGMTRQTTEKV